MNRRRFLGLLGGATVAAAAPSIVRAQTLGRAGGTAPSNRLNVGVIGGGGISIGHIAHILNDSSLQLATMCDVDRNVLEMQRQKISAHYAEQNGTASWDGLRTTGDFREVINDPSIDVIFNCVPDHWHALPVIYAARAGKHIYSEKPLSRTAEEGWAMVNAVERAGIVCQIGSQQRSSPEFQRAITIVRNGLLGKIHHIKVGLPAFGGVPNLVSTQPQPVPANLDYEMWVGPSPWIPYIAERHHFHWRWRYEFAGGQLTDWINHHYDIAQIMLGVSGEIPHTLKKVKADFGLQPIYNTPSSYEFEAHYSNGGIIEVSSSNRLGIRVGRRERLVLCHPWGDGAQLQCPAFHADAIARLCVQWRRPRSSPKLLRLYQESHA